MSSRAWPYRRPVQRVVADQWQLGADDPVPLPGFLPSWDYSTDLALSRVVRVRVEDTRADCGLPADAQLRLLVRHWASTSLIRYVAFETILEGSSSQTVTVIDLSVQGRDTAGVLTIETLLELAADVPDAEPFAPRRAGSVLWSEQVSVRLEGGGGLLPIAPVSFTGMGLQAKAAWYVSMDIGGWDQAAMGSLLVLVNTDNVAVKAALESPSLPGSVALWANLEADVVTDLVGRALDDESFEAEGEPGDPSDAQSMAGLVHALVRGYLVKPTETASQAIKRIRDERKADPSRFRADVQAGLGYPQGMK